MSSLERRVDQALASGTADLKLVSDKIAEIINELIESEAYGQLNVVFNRILMDNSQHQVVRSAATQFASLMKKLPPEVIEGIVIPAIDSIKNHLIPLDETDFMLRDIMFHHFIGQEQFKEAAQTLASANLENFNDHDKTDIYVKCAECFLEDDETVDAEVFLNKASGTVQTVTDVSLLLRYRVTSARVLDANRKFVEAALRYYDLSNTTATDVVQEDLLELLGKAVTCAVLGKVGPQRSRVMGLLYKDERLRNLEQQPKYSSHAAVLAKMYTEQILRRDELSAFEASLSAHQKAMTSEGFSLPEKAVIEHNMLATGRIYDNITFSELGNILRLDAAKAEKVAARMIAEDRLRATIDQTAGLLIFHEDANSDALLSWDMRIKEVCEEVSECVEKIQQLHPQFVV